MARMARLSEGAPSFIVSNPIRRAAWDQSHQRTDKNATDDCQRPLVHQYSHDSQPGLTRDVPIHAAAPSKAQTVPSAYS